VRGPKLFEWKRNPVTLVATVVTRKTAVQSGTRCARHMPIVTTTPQAMAMRLIATWRRVKAPVDIPRIMAATMHLPSPFRPSRAVRAQRSGESHRSRAQLALSAAAARTGHARKARRAIATS